MFTSKGTTIYQDGVEMAYIRTYHGTAEQKHAFAAAIAAGLNATQHAINLHNVLTDLVALVKAPDKNLTTYAGQVRSTIRDADRVLGEYRESIPKVVPTPYVDDDDLLDPKAIDAAAFAFDRNLSDVVREHAEAGGLEVVDLPLVLGSEMRAIPIERQVEPLRGLSHDAAPLEMSEGAAAAIRTLQSKGYTYHGGEQWKPPIGPVPNFDTQHVLVESVLSNVPGTLTTISPRQRDAILAGLRLLQAGLQHGRIELNALAEIVDNIAADSGECLTIEQIDALCEQLND
jgi:hypothetical protein